MSVRTAERPRTSAVMATSRPATPIAVGKPTQVRLAVRNGAVDVTVNVRRAGTLTVPGDRLHDGQIHTGRSVAALAVPPPHPITFADVDIRTL
jgi:hypothetical protein